VALIELLYYLPLTGWLFIPGRTDTTHLRPSMSSGNLETRRAKADFSNGL